MWQLKHLLLYLMSSIKDGLLEERWDEAGKQHQATDDQWKGLLSYVFLSYY